MDGNGCVNECLSSRRCSSAQALDHGEICLRSICQASRPSPTTTLVSTISGQVNVGVVFGELKVLLFVQSMVGREWMCE